jgi:hypothetical protein
MAIISAKVSPSAKTCTKPIAVAAMNAVPRAAPKVHAFSSSFSFAGIHLYEDLFVPLGGWESVAL